VGKKVHELIDIYYKARNVASDKVLQHVLRETYECLVCKNEGAFTPAIGTTGSRPRARCPKCGALERHRLQHYAVSLRILPRYFDKKPRILHVAPEKSIQKLLKPIAGKYVSADYNLPGMDMKIDLRDINLEDGSFDIVYASHVLEHIDDDRAALSEIRRILAPGGVAVLPVPLVGEQTIEYLEPNPYEAYHVRAPGYDYYERYGEFFDEVEQISSNEAPARGQTYIYEDRSQWPTKHMPLRKPSTGERHLDVVPLCWVEQG
jgi:SAM-dependent methyltransferase